MQKELTYTQEQHLLLELLQSAIWARQPESSLFKNCNWETILLLAKEQAIQGAVIESMGRLPKELLPDTRTYIRWQGKLVHLEDRNTRMDEAVCKIVHHFEDMGTHPLIVKGQLAALCYPHPHHRQCGDIDIWFPDSGEAEQVFRWAQKTYHCRWMPGEKETGFTTGGITIELHRRLADMQYEPYQQTLQHIIHQAQAVPHFVRLGNRDIACLSPTFNALYQIIHIQYHLLNEGIGLRQFCDLATFLGGNEPNIDRRTLQNQLAQIGLTELAATIGYLLETVLGLAPGSNPFGSNSKYASMIMEDIWTGGNFGKKKWAFKAAEARKSGWRSFFSQKLQALPLHYAQYRKYRKLLPHEAWANFMSKFGRAARGIK